MSILTFQEGRLASTHMKLSFQPTGTHPSQRSAWEWKSDTRWSSLYSSSKPVPSTHWFLMVFTDLPHWVATRGSRWLVLKLPYSLTVTRRDSTPNGATAIPDTPSEQPELVSLVTNKTTALAVTPESGLFLEDTPTNHAYVYVCKTYKKKQKSHKSLFESFLKTHENTWN